MADKTDGEGWSTLHHAVTGRFTNLVHSLLEQEGDGIVNTQDAQGRTPLHLVCSDIITQDVPLSLECFPEDITTRAITETQQIIQLLLSNGADPQVLDNKGKSPLHCLVDLWRFKKYPVNHFGKIINQFVHCTGNINVKDSNGRSMLHYVAGSPIIRDPIARTRQARRAGLNALEIIGNVPQQFIGNGNDRLLAEAERIRGAHDPGRIENAPHLIGNGNERLQPVAERMVGRNIRRRNLLQELIQRMPNEDLVANVGNGNERLQPVAERMVGRNLLQELIQRMPNEDLVANVGNGNERLQPVAERMVGRNILQELIQRMPNEDLVANNANEEESYWITPIVSKVFRSSPEDENFSNALLTQLLNYGAKINLGDNKGNTPLHLAVAFNKFEVVRELLKSGSDVNIRNTRGQTALHLAVSGHDKFKNCAILLLHKGARANIQDVRGKTPVDIVNEGDFPCFLRHVILLISSKLHPDMMISSTRHESARLKIEYEQECEKLNSHFELEGKSQLPILVQYHNFPAYTGNEFFQQKINCDSFLQQFPIYSLFLKYKFSQDKNRREMIEKCTHVFSWFGSRFYYMCADRLVSSINRHWENLPVELKIKILSYLSNNDLEYLEKQLV